MGLLFSATMPDFQTKQFHALMKRPPVRVKLRVGHYNEEDQKGGSCRHISQTLIRVRDMDDRWARLGRDLMEMWGSTTQNRQGEFEMLIASNVASRGLDFPDIRLVVQFELPKTVEIYTHRIGRTGRNGQSGMAISYFWDV